MVEKQHFSLKETTIINPVPDSLLSIFISLKFLWNLNISFAVCPNECKDSIALLIGGLF